MSPLAPESFYVEPPSIPPGLTVTLYRRRRAAAGRRDRRKLVRAGAAVRRRLH
jgi:hypothetical protein